jgi:hypothetical protein
LIEYEKVIKQLSAKFRIRLSNIEIPGDSREAEQLLATLQDRRSWLFEVPGWETC